MDFINPPRLVAVTFSFPAHLFPSLLSGESSGSLLSGQESVATAVSLVGLAVSDWLGPMRGPAFFAGGPYGFPPLLFGHFPAYRRGGYEMGGFTFASPTPIGLLLAYQMTCRGKRSFISAILAPIGRTLAYQVNRRGMGSFIFAVFALIGLLRANRVVASALSRLSPLLYWLVDLFLPPLFIPKRFALGWGVKFTGGHCYTDLPMAVSPQLSMGHYRPMAGKDSIGRSSSIGRILLLLCLRGCSGTLGTLRSWFL